MNSKIMKNIDNETRAVQIIKNHNSDKCGVIISDEFFSSLYETDYNENLKNEIKSMLNEEAILFEFTDKELTEAWKDSYTKAGISEDRWDRRTIFHPYNEMNEMFCMGSDLLDDITGKWIGTPWECTEESCNWKYYMIEWYKTKII